MKEFEKIAKDMTNKYSDLEEFIYSFCPADEQIRKNK